MYKVIELDFTISRNEIKHRRISVIHFTLNVSTSTEVSFDNFLIECSFDSLEKFCQMICKEVYFDLI